MKKILILNYEYPPLGGGAGVVTRHHAEDLAQRGFHITVLTTWFEGEKEISEHANLTIVRLRSRRKYVYKSNPPEMLSWIYKAKKYLSHPAQNRFDLCMAHYAIPGGVVANFLKRKYGIPYIVISHGEDVPWVHKERMFKFHLLTYFWLKRIFKNSVQNVVLTSEMKTALDTFLGKNHKSKNRVIPNGCPAEQFHPDNGSKETRFTILFVGRFQAVKQPMILLKALKILKAGNIDFSVKMLGDGPLRPKLEAYAKKHHLNDHVNFGGWVSKEELAEMYQKSHVMVVCSRFEAFSVAMLEALFSGLYLISTPVSGTREIINEKINGSFYAFGNEKQLAESLSEFFHSKFLSHYQIPDDLIHKLRNRYSWAAITESYAVLCETLSKEK
jgi:glycosyltransferase involved in cell wall biosynthesis